MALSLTRGTVPFFAQALPTDSTIRSGKLANGLSYYIKYNNQTPGQADFYLANRVGSILEKPEQRGLAHFLEHMAFNGTQHFPGGNGAENSVRGWCEKNGIKFGADLNAYTSIDVTVYNIANAPVRKNGVTDTCLLILRDWSSSLLLNPEEIDNERGVIREEWRSRRSRFATTRMMEEAMPLIYQGTKYEDCLPIGHIGVIDTFPHKRLREFYEDWYRPDLQAVIVAGDINVDSIEFKIKDLFSDISLPKEKPERVYYPVGDNDRMIVYTQADNEQPTLNLSLYMKRDSEPRNTRNTRKAYMEGYKSKLAMFILRQRLAQLGHEPEPRIMSVSVRDNSFYITSEKDAFMINIGLLPDNPSKGIDAVIEVVEKAKRFGFTESELEHAKIQHTVQIEHKRESKEKTRNAEYIHGILENFLNGNPNMDIESEALLQAELNEIITLDDINETVNDIISDSNQVLIVLGPTRYNGDDYIMPSGSDFENWILTAQQKEYANDFEDKSFDRVFIGELPQKGSIISKQVKDNGFTDYLLSNGIKVSTRASALEPNRLTIKMFRNGGKSLYGDEDIMTLQFLNTVVKESGASDFDYLTLEKKRRGKALRVVPFIDTEEEGVKGVCAASDLKTWLEVAYLYITQPRKDERIFNSIMGKQRSLLKNRNANPNVDYNDSLRIAVYGLSEKTLPISNDRLGKVDLNRMYEIYNERFSNLAGMNLIITGDIREDEIDDLLCQYVASLPGEVDFTNESMMGENLMDIRKGEHINVFSKEMKTPSALTNIIYSADLPFTSENDLKLDVLAQIMKAIFTEKIREDKGGTYGVSVNGQFWKEPEDGCSLTINFRCNPGMYGQLLPLIDEELKKIAKYGPTEKQLDHIKEFEKKNYDRAVLTNGWWEYVRYNQIKNGIDFNTGYVERVNALTRVDVKEICGELLESGNRIQVTMIPEE